MMFRVVATFGIVALLAGAFSVLYVFACDEDSCAIFDWQKIKITTSFEDCANRGFPIMESFPRQCRAGDKIFTEDVSSSNNPFLKQFELPDKKEYEIKELNSGIKGRILIGPVCPVIQFGDEEKCADRAYQTSLRIYDEEKNLVKVIRSDKEGKFEADLPPGTYVLDSDGEAVMPSAEPMIVLVESGMFTPVTFTFDSGIR